MKNKKGFTLIEIAIVLVIIGLLAGGILKGQQMIESAKYKAWVKEVDAYKVAIYTFRDRYKYLPGDFPFAINKLPNPNSAPVLNGNGDGIILSSMTSTEPYQAYLHLVLAGLISGDPTDIPATSLPARWPKIPAPIGGYMAGFSNAGLTNINRSFIIAYHNVPAGFARRYDEEFDDGAANAGIAVCWPVTTPCSGAAWQDDDQLVSIFISF